MIRGFKQTAGIGYHEKFNLVLEKFSPVARFDSIKIILSVSVTNKIYLQQFNVKTVFLHGEKLIYKAAIEGIQKWNWLCLHHNWIIVRFEAGVKMLESFYNGAEET